MELNASKKLKSKKRLKMKHIRIRMDKLLIIADDFTGALDTGVQFAQRGASAIVFSEPIDVNFQRLDDNVSVVIVNSESRHIAAEFAYKRVLKITADAFSAGFSYVYKKTDSALRGNIGSELTAALDGSPYNNIKFIPAFPKMNRITKNGIQLIDGIPVSESVFGKGPFEPVLNSDVRQIISAQTSVDVSLNPNGEKRGICVYDASTDEDMRRIGEKLKVENLHLSAGCAGFATVLADLIGLKPVENTIPKLPEGLFIVSGSLNPVSSKQISYAERAGFPRIVLTSDQKKDSKWLEHDGNAVVSQIIQSIRTKGTCIVDVKSDSGDREVETLRKSICASIGHLFSKVIDSGLNVTFMCIGGDTLQAVFRVAGITSISPICEILPGVVLSEARHNNRSIFLLSKSGGFGDENLLVELGKYCCGEREKEAVCD